MADPQTQRELSNAEGEIPITPDAQSKPLHRPGGDLAHTPNEKGETPTGIVGTTTGGIVRQESADSIGSGTVGVPTGSGATGANSSGETPSVTGNTTTVGGDVP